MKKFLLLLAVLALPLAGRAQEDAEVAIQRARMASERSQVEAAFRAEEKVCYGKFAVNDCLNEARGRRRVALADLRRQEISLNDAQRKRRAAERMREIEQRVPPEKRGTAAADQQEREARAAQKSTDRAAAEASAPAKAAERQEQVRRKQAEAATARLQRGEEAAKHVQDQKKREADAKERRANLEKRLAEQKKPAAAPLPVPP
ncbi:MAG: hypothetical protein JWQ07_3406 [Ramlibacter sp.]|nr:hypothetical protein [Ramlibacter sp.]